MNANRMEPDRPPCHRQCYRPAVFFCHIRLIAPSFLQGKTRNAF